MTYFETLNPTVKACISFGHGDEPKGESNIFGVGASFESLLKHLSLESYFCLGGYPYLLLHVKILLLSGATMKGSFQMWHLWPNRFLASQGHKVKHI